MQGRAQDLAPKRVVRPGEIGRSDEESGLPEEDVGGWEIRRLGMAAGDPDGSWGQEARRCSRTQDGDTSIVRERSLPAGEQRRAAGFLAVTEIGRSRRLGRGRTRSRSVTRRTGMRGIRGIRGLGDARRVRGCEAGKRTERRVEHEERTRGRCRYEPDASLHSGHPRGMVAHPVHRSGIGIS